jgi:hypothetical protein
MQVGNGGVQTACNLADDVAGALFVDLVDFIDALEGFFDVAILKVDHQLAGHLLEADEFRRFDIQFMREIHDAFLNSLWLFRERCEQFLP